MLRELNLSDVPASGPCSQCLVALPNGKKVEAVTTAGLAWPPDDASIAYDAATDDIVISYDGGQPNPALDEAPVTPWVTVATISESGLLSGLGTWDVLGDIGSCLSGHTLNHNSGIVRQPNGDMPNGHELSMMYTVANHNLQAVWGVWGYRIWNLETPLGSGLSPQGRCQQRLLGIRRAHIGRPDNRGDPDRWIERRRFRGPRRGYGAHAGPAGFLRGQCRRGGVEVRGCHSPAQSGWAATNGGRSRRARSRSGDRRILGRRRQRRGLPRQCTRPRVTCRQETLGDRRGHRVDAGGRRLLPRHVDGPGLHIRACAELRGPGGHPRARGSQPLRSRPTVSAITFFQPPAPSRRTATPPATAQPPCLA